MAVKTVSLLTALVGVFCGFASMHPLQEEARAACTNKCHEGHCWKYEPNCVKFFQTTAEEFSNVWASTGGGTIVRGESITGRTVQTCKKECVDKEMSRAMKGFNYADSTCGGNELGDFIGDTLNYCGS